MPVDQSDTQSGVEHPGVDIAGASFLVRLVHLVVCAGIGAVARRHSVLDAHHGLGCGLQQYSRSTEREQKSLFRQKRKG